MMDQLQSAKPLFDGAPEFLTLSFALIAAGVLLLLILLAWISGTASRRRAIREEEQREALYDIEAETPAARPITPMPVPMPVPASFDEILPPSPPAPEPVVEAEPAMVPPEPETAHEPVVMPASEPEPEPDAPVIDQDVVPEHALEADAAPEVEPVALEGAPAREPDPAPLDEAPNPAAGPINATPAGIEEAVTDPAPAAEGETLWVPPSAPEVIPTPAVADDLTRMKGVGPRLAERLNTIGVTSFAQIAALSPEECEALDSKLGDFQGRINRDRWVEQAGFLASGDIDGFEEKFGKL